MKKLLVSRCRCCNGFFGRRRDDIGEHSRGCRRGRTNRPSTTRPRSIVRARPLQTLDNIFKQTIVLITDKYVHDEDDFAAGSAAVLLFENISKSGDNKIRLIDATGEPYD